MLLLLIYNFSNINAQVKYQTGSAEFGLPIFQWEDDRSKLISAVSLSYSSGNGLKVADVASNIGQGWNLQIGGSITRIQSGEPDDQKPRDGNFDDITKYPPGYLYDPISAIEGCPKNLTEYPIFKAKNKIYKPYNLVTADKELDRFAFEINGRSGIFFLKKNNADKAVLVGDSKMKVWYTRDENMPNIRTTINAFFVQDENGIIYKFSKLALTKVLKTRYSDASGVHILQQPNFKEGKVYYEGNFDDGSLVNPYIVNGWMLTEMEDALTHRKIFFNYVVRNVNASAGTTFSSYAESNYSIISFSKSITLSPEISSITYPDGHIVTVNYGENRFDLNGQNIVKSVDVQYQGKFISKYELNTQYFIGNRIGIPTTDYQKSIARLCLTSIKKYGVELMSYDEPYKFEYYTGSSSGGDIVPPPFTYKKDIWGYYNGTNSQNYYGQFIDINKTISELNKDDVFGLCFIRFGGNSTVINPKNGYAKNGLLKKIIYPTGGSLKYEYEQNTGILFGQNSMIGGVHVSKSIASDEGNNYNCDLTNLTTNYEYVTSTGSAQSSIWGVENPINKYATQTYYEPRKKRYTWGIRGCGLYGCCKYKFQYPGILSREQAIDLTGHQKFLEALSAVLDVVSLVTTVLDIVNVALGATGAGAIIALVIDALVGYYILFSTCFRDYSKTTFTTVYYNSDLNNNPLPIQYSRVETYENTGNNGRTIFEFTSPIDYPIWEPTNPSFSNKQRFAYWAYGLSKKTTVLNLSGAIVKQTENIYDYQFARSLNTEIIDENGVPQTTPINGVSCKCLVKKSKSNRSDYWMDTNNPDNNPVNYTKNMTSNSELLADIYYMSTGRVELRNTIEKVYQTGSNNFISTNTTYEYGKNYLPNKVTTTQSNGDVVQTSTVYTIDSWLYGSNQGTFLPRLVQNNILNLPIATKSTIKKANDNITYDLNETITTYGHIFNINNSYIKPQNIITRRYNVPEPVTSNSVYYHGPAATYNPSYKIVKSLYYDENGILVETYSENGERLSYLYDYDDKYIVATIINGGAVANTKDNTYYTTFETSKNNGWEILGSPNYVENAGITGKRAFQLNSNNSIKASSIQSCTEYRLTFWSSNLITNVTVLGGGRTITLVNAGPTINGLTFYEYKVSHCTESGNQTITIAGNGIIDELRLYVADARMFTSTYNPLLGKTSTCDENNRITYYEYDEKGRIRFVKDEKSNIVKMYEYNNATNKRSACPDQNPLPLEFTNLETSEIFIKNDCKTGLIGTAVTYTIPAGTYTSTISQEVVDLLVQQNLQANGQAYANANGTCIQQYTNEAVSAEFTKDDCEVGYKGTTITYTVPAGQYFSTISQAEANALALAEVNANGQAYVNTPGNASCIIDTDPEWEGVEPAQTQCGTGAQAGHQLVLAIDINPNSPTYNTTQWTDGGLNAACGGAVTPDIDITYTNAGNTQATLKLINLANNQVYVMNLNPNTSTTTITGFVPAGNYDITVTLPYGSNAQNISVYNNTQVGAFHATPINVTTSGSPIVRITL